MQTSISITISETRENDVRYRKRELKYAVHRNSLDPIYYTEAFTEKLGDIGHYFTPLFNLTREDAGPYSQSVGIKTLVQTFLEHGLFLQPDLLETIKTTILNIPTPKYNRMELKAEFIEDETTDFFKNHWAQLIEQLKREGTSFSTPHEFVQLRNSANTTANPKNLILQALNHLNPPSGTITSIERLDSKVLLKSVQENYSTQRDFECAICQEVTNMGKFILCGRVESCLTMLCTLCFVQLIHVNGVGGVSCPGCRHKKENQPPLAVQFKEGDCIISDAYTASFTLTAREMAMDYRKQQFPPILDQALLGTREGMEAVSREVKNLRDELASMKANPPPPNDSKPDLWVPAIFSLLVSLLAIRYIHRYINSKSASVQSPPPKTF